MKVSFRQGDNQMLAVKSMQDFQFIKEKALQKKQRAAKTRAEVIVGMGTCGIAAGAGNTMKAILNYIEQNKLSDIRVTQVGCIGLCEMEPIVQVSIGENPKIAYGKVTLEVAERIIKEHIQEGKSLPEHIINI
jgi:NADP-reducing hydrogenase subunit HndB